VVVLRQLATTAQQRQAARAVLGSTYPRSLRVVRSSNAAAAAAAARQAAQADRLLVVLVAVTPTVRRLARTPRQVAAVAVAPGPLAVTVGTAAQASC